MFLPELMTHWKHETEACYVVARSSLAALIVGVSHPKLLPT